MMVLGRNHQSELLFHGPVKWMQFPSLLLPSPPPPEEHHQTWIHWNSASLSRSASKNTHPLSHPPVCMIKQDTKFTALPGVFKYELLNIFFGTVYPNIWSLNNRKNIIFMWISHEMRFILSIHCLYKDTLYLIFSIIHSW